jgi:hypothetical protein
MKSNAPVDRYLPDLGRPPDPQYDGERVICSRCKRYCGGVQGKNPRLRVILCGGCQTAVVQEFASAPFGTLSGWRWQCDGKADDGSRCPDQPARRNAGLGGFAWCSFHYPRVWQALKKAGWEPEERGRTEWRS